MVRIFVSHASSDDLEVDTLSDWLTTNGYDNHFVDHKHISAGASWDRELPRQAGQSEVLLLYVTKAWLSSSECFSEYRSAYYAGKHIIPLFVSVHPSDLSSEAATRFSTLCSSVQGIQIEAIPLSQMSHDLLRGSLDLH